MTASRVPCAHCAAPTPRVTRGMAFCAGDRREAERIFRLSHSALDKDWLPELNRVFGTGESILEVLRTGSAARPMKEVA